MSYSRTTEEPLFTEVEASQRLGISLPRLYRILDENVFNNGERRPASCSFRGSDLTLLAFWLQTSVSPKVAAYAQQKLTSAA